MKLRGDASRLPMVVVSVGCLREMMLDGGEKQPAVHAALARRKDALSRTRG